VASSNGDATGPVGFLHVYDQAFGEIAQGGSRRGANMAVLRVDHPDIRKFITCKVDEGHITNFNISVAITDPFMQAVRDDKEFDLVNPQDSSVWETARAREIFDLIIKHAHHNGEPGMLFIDTANRDNPVAHLYQLEATNPCGEQWLGPNENCCLGSINLGQHVTGDNRVDWDRLRQSIETASHFLDDVVDANQYVPSVPVLKEAAHRVRRIGLGIMGLGDMMYQLGVRYGSEEGQEFAAQVTEFVHYHCMRTSVELAKQRGPFPAIRGSRFDPDDLEWSPPEPLAAYTRDWDRPALDWKAIEDGIRQHGIRNGAHTTIAPTGTISTVAGVEGYGCEPVFALAYVRYFDDKGTRRELQYTSPQFEKALLDAGLDEPTRRKIIAQVNLTGSCQAVPEVPESVKRVFVVAGDITAEEHVRMQAAMQRFVSNSISKTCNFPAGASEKDVARAFMLAWELGCKGLTVYVAGSRDKVVLETAETRQARTADSPPEKPAEPPRPVEQPGPAPAQPQPRVPETTISPGLLPLFGDEAKKPRGRVLPGYTYRIETPLGTTFVTVNENGGAEPFEVFMHTSKAGSDTAAISEAIGRLISYLLRLRSPVPPHERVKEVIRQLVGIGGGRPLGLGPNRVRSLPDGMAQVLDEYLQDRQARLAAEQEPNRPAAGPGTAPVPVKPAPGQMAFKFGDLCPECGQAAIVNEEGCRKCYACGFSEC
jgi:ribonucleoside-diphosphate reductase alpha chain